LSGKAKRLPPGSWTAEPLELLESDAWRSAGINTRRFIDFLKREHLRHGGKENGRLKAPWQQLEAYGIGARHIAEAIKEAERLGLVEVHRHGMRTASTYTLTCLHDGNSASWRVFRNPDLAPLPVPKSRNLPHKGKAALPSEGKADGPNLPHKGKADGPKNLPSQGKVLSRRSSYQGGREYSLGEEAAVAAAVVPLRSRREAAP
jgi:hypothetical protein